MRCSTSLPLVALLTLGTAMACCLTSCSLITIESPAMPLSDRNMNARISTHRFVEHFIDEVRETADAIALSAETREVVLDAIRWKVGATVALTVSGFETSPRDALVDSWAYCVQMTGFFRDGVGSQWFGTQHALALAKSVELEGEIAALARKFAPTADVGRWEEFVLAYAAKTPIRGMETPRQSSIASFYEFMEIDEDEAIETVGSLGQVLNDFSSRMGILGGHLPRETAWRSELFLYEQGVDRASLHEELERFGARLERVAAVADRTPGLVDESLTRLQEELASLVSALRVEREAVMASLAGEREAAMGALGRERESLVEAFSRERAATMEELETYVDKLVEDVFSQINGLAGIVLAGLIALVLVIFGIPFGIGVLVGRLSKRSV